MRPLPAWPVAEGTSGSSVSCLQAAPWEFSPRSSCGSWQSSGWALEAWLKLGAVTLCQRPLWPRALSEHRAEHRPKEPSLCSSNKRTGNKESLKIGQEPGVDASKNGIAGQTFLPDLLWDVRVLWMEKGQLFLRPSNTDVLWAQDLSNRITWPVSLNISLYLGQTGKGKSVS